MKKVVIVVFFVYVLYSRMNIIDMSQYQSNTKQIEVKGEVLHPGTYEMELHATIQEVIKKAGGLTSQSDISGLNQNQDLQTQTVLVIPKIQQLHKISINSASVEELDILPGVGPSIAKRIMEYRKHTPFQTIEQLKEVKGIGEVMFEKIKEQICL